MHSNNYILNKRFIQPLNAVCTSSAFTKFNPLLRNLTLVSKIQLQSRSVWYAISETTAMQKKKKNEIKKTNSS